MIDPAKADTIKRIALIGIFSVDDLMDRLLLKGGNALDVGYDLGHRGSYDLDFSMESDFEDYMSIMASLKSSLVDTFAAHGYELFDFRSRIKPSQISEEVKDFWGGYEVTFKVIAIEDSIRLGTDLEAKRRKAIVLRPNNSPTLTIEISKFEYISSKFEKEIDGFTIYIYPAELISLEKVRAICQQLPDYKAIIGSKHVVGRSRDFYDIYILHEQFGFDYSEPHLKEMLEKIFAAKRVPISYLKKVRDNREIHAQDFPLLRDTVSQADREEMEDFDFYFEFFLDKFENLFD